VIDEIWRVVTAALKQGQRRFQVHIFPFRMTEENLARRDGGRWEAFWRDLKPGHDAFEATQLPPTITVCNGRYAVSPGSAGADGSAEIVAGCPTGPDART
jgi:murein L,D-transpeptidase YafK